MWQSPEAGFEESSLGVRGIEKSLARHCGKLLSPVVQLVFQARMVTEARSLLAMEISNCCRLKT